MSVRHSIRRPRTPISAAALVILGSVAASFPAGAQSPSRVPPSTPAETVNLTMEQKHVIKEIILKDMKIPAAGTHVAPKLGQTAPSGVTLQPLPVEVAAKVPQVKTHSYFVEGDKVVIVDPKDNKIAAVVE